MMHLVTGGSGSGKSAYAEQQVLEAGDAPRYYIATMMPYGEEGRRRVEKHRRMRREKHFETIECLSLIHIWKYLSRQQKHANKNRWRPS